MSQSGPGRREVAYRLFAAEFDDSELSYSESDEERAPNYVVTPTGARVNRLFAVGVLTEVEDVNPEMVRGRVVDPTGAFITYAGQYQPDALAFLERADPPSFLALSGKARTYEPEDGDQIYTSVRPESVSEVDAETRDRWVVTAAERTIERIGITASAIESGLSGDRLQNALSEAGVDDRLAEGVRLALDHYGTTPAYLEALRGLAIDAVRVVAGERNEVDRLELAPSEGGGDPSFLSTLDLSVPAEPPETTESTQPISAGDDGSTEAAVGESAMETESEPGTEPEPDVEAATISDATDDAEPSATTDIGSETESVSVASTSEPETSRTETETKEEEESEILDEPDADSIETESDPTPENEPAEPTDPIESASAEEREAVEEELEDFDPGEFELDEEVRQEVEEEYGTEFSTAGDVESMPTDTEESPDEIDTEPAATESESGPTAEEPEPEPEPEPEMEQAKESTGEEELDLVEEVMAVMERLDDGEGTEREELVSTITAEHDVTSENVSEAIQEALMSGRCYEPSDGTLKSI